MHDTTSVNLARTHPMAQTYSALRTRSREIAAPLSAEDCQVQSMLDASPIKWHLAHTTWFFETFILEPYSDRYIAFDPSFKVLFNSYYNGVGSRSCPAAPGNGPRPPTSATLDSR